MTTPFALGQCGPNWPKPPGLVGERTSIRRPNGTGNPSASLRALAVRQPWAWALIHLGKDVENRTWHTRFRGPVLIHASSCPAIGRRNGEWDAARRWIAQHVGQSVADKLPEPEQLQYGGIIGQLEIVGCEDALSDEANSPWFEGPWGFVVRNPIPMEFRPCRGSLGFFEPVFEEAA